VICARCRRAADNDRPDEHCDDPACTCQHKERGTDINWEVVKRGAGPSGARDETGQESRIST
jgi:hypothetical protein